MTKKNVAKIKNKQELLALAKQLKSDGHTIHVRVSMGTCGIAANTKPVLDALVAEVKKRKIEKTVKVTQAGCMGLCHSEPSIEVVDISTGKGVIYGKVAAEQIPAILDAGAKGTDAAHQIKRSWYYPEDEEAKKDILQARIVLRNSGNIDPESIEEYIAREGYQALAHVLLEMTPQQVIDLITESGLRGRGGGGFPTGRKWRFAAERESDQKYIICNADEGDPGAFMDRAVLEGDPHAVLEAMVIAGYAIGSSDSVVYIRAEYPLAIKRLEIAIKEARKRGFIGNNILGSKFSFDIKIKYGAGAFVCGEETALISSIEGKRGQPFFKPPFPAVKGLWGKPTIVNNVETFANIPAIIRKGAKWYRSIGTENSPGTKVFALAGKVNKVGLIEVPMGTTLRDIIFGLGEGIEGNKEFKAVQTGGPSGGCISENQLDTPIDYDTLKELGSMMGSGGMIVVDQDDCMVSVAKFFLQFTMDESCGKCTPCRVGARQMYAILEKITTGNATMEDLDLLKDLCIAVKTSSLCGLGTTAPNPVLATLNCFAEEYREHVVDKRCVTGKCRDLVMYKVDPKMCTGCTLCARACPVSCITGKPKEVHEIDQDECIRCGACYAVCKFDAIIKE